MLTNCTVAIIDDFADNFSMNLGSAVYFKGSFSHPWFFDSPRRIMMEDYSDKNLHFKTIHGEIFQFRLGVFHSNKMMLLTSTLEDTFWFHISKPSIAHTMKMVRMGQKKYSSKTSYSGYVCWGEYFEDLCIKLTKHLAEEGVELRDEDLQAIAKELLRREQLYEV